jgi:hypothetical protein
MRRGDRRGLILQDRRGMLVAGMESLSELVNAMLNHVLCSFVVCVSASLSSIGNSSTMVRLPALSMRMSGDWLGYSQSDYMSSHPSIGITVPFYERNRMRMGVRVKVNRRLAEWLELL